MATAGWYEDPWDPQGLRWWDGTAWTANARPRAAAVVPPPAGVPVVTSDGVPIDIAAADARRRNRIKVGAAVAAALVVGVGVGGAVVRRTDDSADVAVSEQRSTVPFASVPETSTSVPPTTAPPTELPTTTAPPTTIDPDVMCVAAFGDPDVFAAFNACTGEQYDRLLPVHGPGRESRVAVCQRATVGGACAGIPVTAPPTTARPATTSAPYVPDPGPSTYYPNCSAARAAGVTPLYRGDAGYASHLDRDGDGVACE